MIYLLLLILSLCLARVQYMTAKKNIGAKWNGYGAIDGVLSRSGDAPMVYRVLVPWIVGKSKKLWVYELCQVILIFSSLLSLYIAWNSLPLVLVAAVLFTITFLYDYWDWTLEIIGFSLALVSFPLAVLSVVLFSLSRETAPLVGLVYFLHSGDWLGGIFISVVAVAILFLVHTYQGEHGLYCDRWMLRVNLRLLASGSIGAWVSVFLCVLGILGGIGKPEFAFLPVVIGSGFLMAKADETRVFVACVPYVAAFLMRLYA